MKKRVLIISIMIFIFIGIIGFSYNSNNNYTFTQDGIKYALTLDGEKTISFPSKGMYRADVTCENATGKWLYDEWKLAIENITSNNVSCNIDFTTIEKESLNNYIISLSGETQGDGQLVNEQVTITDYTNAIILNQSEYNNVTMYSSSSDSSTSGISNTNSFTFSGDSWSSVRSNLSSNTYYHINFKVPENGCYQVCYTMSSGFYNNELHIYKGTIKQYIDGRSYISASTSSSKTGCVDLGYIDTNTDVRIIQRAYSSYYPTATVTFNLQQGSATFEDAGIRYEGKNPNNYILFNNELWRIIGVFDEDSHGQSGQNLVKIIRANSLGGLVWNNDTSESSYSSNNWVTSDLMNLLNGAYLNAEDGTDSGYCYGYEDLPANCDYTTVGINETYRNMIANVRWYLGGHSDEDATVDTFYTAERGTTVYSGRPTYWDGKIGLMYVSDYGYSVPANSCNRSKYLGQYNTSTCLGESWLYGQGNEWTITPNSSYSYEVFNVNYYGGILNSIYSYYAKEGYRTRPVLYLDSSVYVIDGNGTMADPYIIGM